MASTSTSPRAAPAARQPTDSAPGRPSTAPMAPLRWRKRLEVSMTTVSLAPRRRAPPPSESARRLATLRIGGCRSALRLPKISSALVGCGAHDVPEADRRSRPSGRSREAGAHCGKMIDRAAATGLLGRDECVRHAAPATNGRSRQDCRDTRLAPPDHGAGTPTRQGPGAVHPERPGISGGPAAPAPHERAPRSAAAGASGHSAVLAPRPSRAPPCCRLPAQAPGTASDRALRADPGAAPGAGEPRLGISPPARRTARSGRESGRFHRLGDLARGRHRSSTRAVLQHLGGLPTLPGRRPTGLRLLRNGHPVRGTAQERSARCGDGSIPAFFRISQTVEAPTLRPRPSNSPWIRRYPHPGFSRARRRTSCRKASGVGGLPGLRDG